MTLSGFIHVTTQHHGNEQVGACSPTVKFHLQCVDPAKLELGVSEVESVLRWHDNRLGSLGFLGSHAKKGPVLPPPVKEVIDLMIVLVVIDCSTPCAERSNHFRSGIHPPWRQGVSTVEKFHKADRPNEDPSTCSEHVSPTGHELGPMTPCKRKRVMAQNPTQEWISAAGTTGNRRTDSSATHTYTPIRIYRRKYI